MRSCLEQATTRPHRGYAPWAVGVYRLWRDAGFALGARSAGLLVAVRMGETQLARVTGAP